MNKLHKVVSSILTENDVHELYRRINFALKNILRERISEMNIINNGGPQHGLVSNMFLFRVSVLFNLSFLNTMNYLKRIHVFSDKVQ